MSFDLNGLSEVRALNFGRRYHAYDTTDTLSAVLTAGYFDAGWYRLGARDRLDIDASDGRIMAVVSAASAACVTITASTDVIPANALGTDSVARSVLAKLLERRTVQDFGAAGTGAVDDAPYINAAITAAVTGSYDLHVPAGLYRCDSQIIVKAGLRLICDKQAVFVKNFSGGAAGDRYLNALIRNQNCPPGATLIANDAAWVPSTYDDDITIIGGRTRPADSLPVGGGVYIMGARRLTIRGMVVERSVTDWAFAIGADDYVLDSLEVIDNTELFEDGIHILYGTRGQIINPRITSGDDAICFGTNYNLPIDGCTILGGTLKSLKGHSLGFYQYRTGVTAAYAPPTEKIKNIRCIGVKAQSAIGRNGLITCSMSVLPYTLAAGGTTTQTLPSSASAVDDFYVGAKITVMSGTGTAGQFRYITAYNGTTKVATVHTAFTTTSTDTVVNIEGILLDTVEIVDSDFVGGLQANHDGNNPFGIRLINARNIKFDNVKASNSIRDTFYLEEIHGTLELIDVTAGDPQESSASYYTVQMVDCPKVMMRGGSYTRRVTHPISASNCKITAVGVLFYDLIASAAGFRLTNTSLDTTTLVANGCKFVELLSGVVNSRAVRVDATGVSYWLIGCDLTQVDQVFFHNSTPTMYAIQSNAGTAVTKSKTSNYSVLHTESFGSQFDNVGASGTITFTLIASARGMHLRVTRSDNQTVRVDPNGSEVIAGGGAGKYLSLDGEGYVDLICVAAGRWIAAPSLGLTTSFEP